MQTLDFAKLAAENVDKTYYNLETLCISFPGRVSGSETLEKALDYFEDFGRDYYPEGTCQSEVVTCVPCWNRGDWKQETCVINIIPGPGVKPEPFPLLRQMRVLANGLSIGTGPDGVSCPMVIINTWDELKERGDKGELKDAIVLFDYKDFIDYDQHMRFRGEGAKQASQYGVKGVLVRSLTPNGSTSGPHTGTQAKYDPNSGFADIPAACISVEDCEMLSRLSARGHGLHATLTLPCFTLPDRSSRNIIFEIKGSEFPEEVVIVGGHTDCWDCQHAACQGAHDDGQAVAISMDIIRIIQSTGLRPRRTIRAVLFVDEEITSSGAQAYADTHAHEAHNIVAAIETDVGVGEVCGFGFTGSDEGREQLLRLLQPLKVLGDVANVDIKWEGTGVDITPLIEDHQVPGLLLRHKDVWWNQEYFHYHHTTADTIDHVDKRLLELNLAVLLGAVWILANCDEKLSREKKEKK